MSLVDELIDEKKTLQSLRGTWENHWQETSDLVVPRKNEFTTKQFPGEKKLQKVFDSTAIHANELLASALHGLLTNPATTFFNLTSGETSIDDQDDVRKWLQDSTRKMHSVLSNSNFQTEIHEVYIDLGSIGTAAMIMEDDDDMVVRFSARHMSEIFIKENNKGFVDTVHRSFEWQARQIIQEFGEKGMPPSVMKAMKDNSTRKFEIIHSVFPAKKKTASKRFESKYILVDERMFLREKGFAEFPYAVPRWTKTSGEVYGRSPSIKTLPDIKMINKIMETTIRAAQKTIDPPLQVPDDGFILPLRTTPGGLNFFRSGSADRIQPLFNQNRVDFGFQMMEDLRKRIRDGYFIDQLQLNQGPQMTATEVLQRTEERARLLGPVLGRQNSELLTPLVDRVFDIMDRKNMFDEIPEVLQQRGRVQVRFSSMIAKSQRASEAQNLLRVVELSAPFLQLDPEARDNFDSNTAVRLIANIFDAPQEILFDKAIVKQTQEARQAAQEEALAAQQQASEVEQFSQAAPGVKQLTESANIAQQ